MTVSNYVWFFLMYRYHRLWEPFRELTQRLRTGMVCFFVTPDVTRVTRGDGN